MMYNYPYFGFPSFRRRYYNPNYLNNDLHNFENQSSFSKNTENNTANNCYNKSTTNLNISSAKEYTHNKEERKNSNNSSFNFDTDKCFNIFGISIHLDDLIILFLLYFLYSEEIDDQYLFIALIFLLLS